MNNTHPLKTLQEDIDKLFEKLNKDIPDTKKNEKIKEHIIALKNIVKDRIQVDLQRQQRRETEDTVFISGENIKTKDDAQDFVINSLKSKLKTSQIPQIVHADKVTTVNKKKLLFKVQLRPKRQWEVAMPSKDKNKDIKMSITSALFNIVREKPDILKPKKNSRPINMQRQIPSYLQDKKKSIDNIAYKLRNMNYQTKTSFNVKDNMLIAKYRSNKNDPWQCMFDDGESLPDEIQDMINDINMDDYIKDEKAIINKTRV